ncbi:hypothetical protein BJ684DRAFT_9936 [Piptocephalis cylindrospora]|uniref:Thioredoxin domain-containing protein n=1 Tax=Piptocephalis cylindrospora TaxID=1907219 RepID=A0A4P9Y3L4_9FUNG|nr:hypothetical protein BJ684DRAFT_9936 [Piptocephalis cylindrospora]|eukprot:RKP13516.1 hypothetical protein BJ684DRAFT_9936 [Piptocephalis cylindrospora]
MGELFKEGQPDSEELQLLAGLAALATYKTWACPTAEERTGLCLLYSKFLSLYLLYQGGSWSAMALFLVNWLLVYVVIRPARYWGPAKAFPLTEDGVRKAVSLTEVARSHKQAKQRKKLDTADQSFMAEAWVILFETKWAPAARYFTVPFAELANTYTSSRLHFGRVDLDVYSALKLKYGIATDSASLDIPTVILFREGKEMLRLPSKTTGKVWDRSAVRDEDVCV